MKKAKVGLALVAMALLTACIKSDRFDTTLTEVKVGRHTFIAPRNYLKSRNSMNMVLLLPDFEPRTKANEHLLNDTTSRRFITIAVHGSEESAHFSSPNFEDGNSSYQESRFSHFQLSEYQTPEMTADGLLHYRPKNSSNRSLEDLYVAKNGEDILFVLECSTHAANPQCAARLTAFTTLGIKYWYPTEYLPSASAIHRRVAELLTTLKKGGSP